MIGRNKGKATENFIESIRKIFLFSVISGDLQNIIISF